MKRYLAMSLIVVLFRGGINCMSFHEVFSSVFCGTVICSVLMSCILCHFHVFCIDVMCSLSLSYLLCHCHLFFLSLSSVLYCCHVFFVAGIPSVSLSFVPCHCHVFFVFVMSDMSDGCVSIMPCHASVQTTPQSVSLFCHLQYDTLHNFLCQYIPR